MSICLRYLLPCVTLRLLYRPLLTYLRDLSPHHSTRHAAVANIFMSTPISAIIAVAARSLTPGMVFRRLYCSGKCRSQSAVSSFWHSVIYRSIMSMTSLVWRNIMRSVSEKRPVTAALIVARPCLFTVLPCTSFTSSSGSPVPLIMDFWTD